MTKKDINTYLRMKISEMSQKQLIVFLYESAINLIEESRETIGKGDLQGTHQRLDRARNIFLHLLATLDLEKGGDFAKKLSSLYAYFVEKITMANTTKNTRELDDILPMVCEIKDCWEKMETENNGPEAPKKNAGLERRLFSVEA